MIRKSMSLKDGAETAVRDIRRKTRKQYSAEEKIRIVLSGLRGEREGFLALSYKGPWLAFPLSIALCPP